MAKTNIVIGSILVLLFINVANATETETHYACWDRYGSKKVILKLWMPEGAAFDGYSNTHVDLHGESIPAIYNLAGLNRIWLITSNQRLQIILKPDMTAGYYNFSNESRVTPDSMFACKKVTNRVQGSR